MKSIKTRLAIIMLLLVLIPLLGINVTNYYFITDNYIKQIESNHSTLANTLSNGVSSFITTAYSVTEEIVHNSDIVSFEPERQVQVLTGSAARNPYVDLFFIQGTDGMQTARSKGKLGDRSQRWWFKQIMEDKKPFVSKSYFSLSGGIPVTSIFIPIYDQSNNLKGIMGTDIKLDTLQEMVEKITKKDGIYAYVIDSEGVVIAHPDKLQVEEQYNYLSLKKTVQVKDSNGNVMKDSNGNEMLELHDINIPTELQRMVKDCLEGKTGFAEYQDINGNQVVSAYAPITLPGASKNWGIVTVEQKGNAFSFVTTVIKRNFAAALLLGAITAVLAYMMAKKIAALLNQIKEAFVKAAAGDLTAEVYIQSQDEIELLGKSYNTMLGQMKHIISDIQQVIVKSKDASTTIMSSTEEVSASSSSIATTIQEIASGADAQAREMNKSLGITNNLARKIEEILSKLRTTIVNSSVMKEKNQMGVQALEKLTTRFEENTQASIIVATSVGELSSKSHSISAIAETIRSIAEQTNLLALNAAIEAARAGEQGRGFAVVAEEVRKLAEQSSSATKDIQSILHEIIDIIEKTNKTMDEAKVIVANANEHLGQTKGIFGQVKDATDDVVHQVELLSEDIAYLEHAKDQVLSSIESISTIAQQSAASTQQISASIEEQTNFVEEAFKPIQELNQMINLLSESIKIFKM